jgi:hypothetical protein
MTVCPCPTRRRGGCARGALPNDQNSLLAKERYAVADFVVKRRRLRRVDAELHDRKVRLRVEVCLLCNFEPGGNRLAANQSR